MSCFDEQCDRKGVEICNKLWLDTTLMSSTRIKNIKNVTRCRDSRSAKSIETR